MTVSGRETGYLCHVDTETPVSLRLAGETADGARVNWYLCDPGGLDAYWDGGSTPIYASFTDWATFDFGPFTTGAAPTAVLVEPVADAATLSYSVTVE